MKKILNILIILVIILPNIIFAITFSELATNMYSKFLNLIIDVLIGFSVLFFMYGIIMVIISEEKDVKKKAKNRMLWGVVILFVMFSFWAIINIFNDSLGLEQDKKYNYYDESFDYNYKDINNNGNILKPNDSKVGTMEHYKKWREEQ